MIKLTLLIVIGVSISLSSVAQRISLGKQTSLTIPKGSIKLSKEQFKSDRAVNTRPISTNNIFRSGSVLFALYDTKESVSTDYLDKTKKWRDEMQGWNENNNDYSSNIIFINKVSVLVIESVINGKGNIDFYVLNNVKNKALNGLIVFELGEKTKAYGILKSLVGDLTF